MRTRTTTIFSAVFAVLIAAAAFLLPEVQAQKKQPAIKIGTYDSRIIALAWSRTDYLKQHMMKFSMQMDSAQKAHDSARVKELTVGIMSYQHLLHLVVFSNGSAGFIMALVKDKLPELAKTTGVSVILSKWELNYSDPSFEVVDLTNQVVQLFQPKENIDKTAAEISNLQPGPIDEFAIETDMLDGYCRLYGKK